MALSAAAITPAFADATDYTVGTGGDSAAVVADCAVATNTDCTLRDAIAAANGHGGADRVLFASTLTGSTITLGSNPSIPITEQLDVVGPGAAQLTVDGAAVGDSILNINLVVPGPVGVSGLKLTNGGGTGVGTVGGAIHDQNAALTVSDVRLSMNQGHAGGAIRSDTGSVTVQHSSVYSNYSAASGGAISAGAASTITDSDFAGNGAHDAGGALIAGGPSSISGSSFLYNQSYYGAGGAIATYSAVTISRSTLSQNVARFGGGGLRADNVSGQPLRVDHSTISGNTSAGSDGGGAYIRGSGTIAHTTIFGNVGGSGGGLAARSYQDDRQLTLENSTVSGNIASGNGGGVYATSYQTVNPSSNPRLIVDSSTIAGNSAEAGAGISVDAAPFYTHGPTLTNTIVAGNSTFKPDGDLHLREQAGPFSAAFSLIQNAASSTFTVTAPSVIGQDPRLGGLADNGGDTLTRALQPGSPAIDAGSTALTDDQRGTARPAGGAADIGAFETAASPSVPAGVPPPGGGPQNGAKEASASVQGRIKVGSNFVSFTLHCADGAACRGLANLFTTERFKGDRVVSIAARKRKKKVVVGTKPFALAAGATNTVKVKVNSRGRRLLAKFKKLPVQLRVSLTHANGTRTVVKTARATIKKPKKTRR